jgi:hypothetical protein
VSEKVQKTKENILYRDKPIRAKNNASKDLQASQQTRHTSTQSAKTLKTSTPKWEPKIRFFYIKVCAQQLQQTV